MANHEKPDSSGKCPDGYKILFGNICLKKTVIDKVDDIVPDLELPDFTDIQCESAVSALKSIYDTVKKAMEMPSKFFSMLNKLVNYPFDVAQKMVDSALSSLDAVSKALDDILSGAGGLSDLKKALEGALDCPILADTELGKLISSILDATDLSDDLLKQLKSSLSSAAKDALNSLKDTPTKAISDLKDAYNQALKNSGISDLMKQLKELEKCVDNLCAAYKGITKFANSLPESSDDFLTRVGAKWDEATSSVSMAALNTTTEVAKQAESVADSFSSAVKIANGTD